MDRGELYKAFAEPIRLRLMYLLRKEGPELCVCDLVSVLNAPQGTISRQLMHLRLLGLVQDRRSGVWVYYRLAPPASKLHAALLKTLDHCFEDDPILQADIKNCARLKKANSLACCPTRPVRGRACSPPPTRLHKVKVL